MISLQCRGSCIFLMYDAGFACKRHPRRTPPVTTPGRPSRPPKKPAPPTCPRRLCIWRRLPLANLGTRRRRSCCGTCWLAANAMVVPPETRPGSIFKVNERKLQVGKLCATGTYNVLQYHSSIVHRRALQKPTALFGRSFLDQRRLI